MVREYVLHWGWLRNFHLPVAVGASVVGRGNKVDAVPAYLTLPCSTNLIRLTLNSWIHISQTLALYFC